MVEGGSVTCILGRWVEREAMMAKTHRSAATVGQMRSLRHCLSAQSRLSVSYRLVQSKEVEPQGESKDSAQVREVEEEKAGVGGGSKAATRAAKAKGSPRIWRSISINY